MQKIKNIYYGALVSLSSFLISCSSKELEAKLEAERQRAEIAETNFMIAVFIAIIGMIIFLIIGNIMGSKTKRDAKNQNESSEEE